MYDTIAATIPEDRDLPKRAWQIDVYTRLLEGRFYDGLRYEFHQERNEPTGEYIPLAKRRPSVRFALPRIVVNDSVALLFSDGHFPDLACDEEDGDSLVESVRTIIKAAKLNAVMIDAATKGSVGSAAVWMRVLKGRIFFEALRTAYLTPEFKADEPDVLSLVRERYKAKGRALRDQGYSIAQDDDSVDFWFQREWDERQERWFLPRRVADGLPQVEDRSRSVTHGLGFVPMVWIRNLPGGDEIDGACTFRAAIDTAIEIDYQLSQAGRGLRYSSDPTLHIKEPADPTGGGAIVKSADNAIVTSKDGDAKLLEIGGTASAAVIEYVRALREFAMESVGGSRVSPEKLATAQSGKAMEMMNQSLIWLADKLRISYGEGALLSLLNMIVRASRVVPIKVGGAVYKDLPEHPITLKWPAWYAPTADDRSAQATAIKTHRDAGVMSVETAVKAIAADYDVEDQQAEIGRIEAETAAQQAIEAKLPSRPAIAA